ncbi:12106_t:CDS:1, partial [Entrophospora sp. SA101]
ENSTEVTSFLDSSRNDNENELQNLINELKLTNPLSGLEYLSIDD